MQLHDYQLVARDFLRGRDRAGLFLDMGLGKTAASLAALEPRHLPVLVIAPKRVTEHVWPAETRLWRPDLALSVAAGDAGQRQAALRSSADIVALGRDNVNDLLGLQRDVPFRTVILDELSSFKSRGARWKTLKKVLRPDQCVWGLTGTPAPNGLLDLWPQMYLLDQGERLGKNITGYRDRYFVAGRQIANGTIVEWNLRPESEANIFAKVSDICLSMSTEGKIELPPVTENIVGIDLPPAAAKAYKDLATKMVADLRDLIGGEVHTAKTAAIVTGRLAQITAGFLYVDDADIRGNAYTHIHTAKMDAAKEIVEGTGGSPVLLFYQFQAELEMLRKAFPKAVEMRDKEFSMARWDSGDIPVLLAHPASAGHGLNLQHGGHTSVWTSLPWPPEQWEQANKRLPRQGQKHPVVNHLVMATGTVDYLIRARLGGKEIDQNRLLAHLESPL